ncbi:TPA: translation initiation factor IF-2 [Escherichia coli]|nr:translation initiation factor IF-2 [Citrobacter freundii]HBZ8454100.1 translation initiation factor IF-2 [Escherichia coli]
MPFIRPADEQDVAQLVQDNAKAAVTNALPGVIRSFDPETVTCDVDIAITARMTKAGTMDEDFQYESVRYPILNDLPVVFPRGGGVTLTFPIKEGDECLIVFSSRSIDFWWQNGGVQERADGRVLDLSDAFVIPGPQSQARKISGISTSAAQLRTDDGSAFIEVAAGGAITITSPQITINGPVQVNGSITSTGDQTANGISQVNHTHGGVQSGGSNTGKPQ